MFLFCSTFWGTFPLLSWPRRAWCLSQPMFKMPSATPAEHLSWQVGGGWGLFWTFMPLTSLLEHLFWVVLLAHFCKHSTHRGIYCRPDTTHVNNLVTYFRESGGNFTTLPQVKSEKCPYWPFYWVCEWSCCCSSSRRTTTGASALARSSTTLLQLLVQVSPHNFWVKSFNLPIEICSGANDAISWSEHFTAKWSDIYRGGDLS